jgi:outer membrane protein TolC
MKPLLVCGLLACCWLAPVRGDDPPRTATTPPAGGDPTASDSATLLGELLEPLAGRPGAPQLAPVDANLYVRPLPLLEAIERAGDKSRRLWISQAYWKVSAAYAQIRCCTEAIERLELIAPGGDPHDRATLDVAAAAARADLADARAQLGFAQQELVDLARLPLTEPLPWPVDRPLAGPYQTHFDAIFATRSTTGRVRAIARTLPSRHEALESRAAAVRAAATAMTMAEADHAKGRRPIEAVIAAHAALVGQQREFLQATKAYNLDIAEYVMAVADASVPDDTFVSMLIGTPIQWRQPPAPAAPVAGGTMSP